MTTRALIVTPDYPGPQNATNAIFVHRQVQHLARAGVRCRVLLYRAAPPPFPRWLARRTWLRYYWNRLRWRGDVDGVPVGTALFRRSWGESEDVVPAIGDALVRFVEANPEYRETDVVYAQWLWTGGAAALALRERFGWPVAAIARGGDLHHWLTEHMHCRGHVERVLREADAVLANCRYLRSRAGDLFPGTGTGIEVVYNGCDADRFRPAARRDDVRRALGLDAQSRMAVFCGTLEERKGIAELAEAWEHFAPRHSEWTLVAIGRAADRGLAASLARSGRVTLLGAVPHDRVLAYLQAADAYVQPSRREGLANATMEAMAVGLPVITTDACGQSELIRDGENGWLVPACDPHALLRALEALASDRDRAARLGQAARRTIETDFNAPDEARRLAALLAGLASRAGGEAAREPERSASGTGAHLRE
jgi:glycosyltransferase involved in cell wall biosynthesis